MKLPRGYGADELIRRMAEFGYVTTRQTGSHVRLTTKQKGEHHVTIPMHHALKVGTLNSIINCISKHFEISRNDVMKRFFG